MDFTKIGQAAAQSEDQSVEKQTTRELPKEGSALLRLRDYIELGRHEAKNPQHKPSNKVLLTFELLHPKHMQEFDGKKEPMTLTVRVNKTATSKGKFLPLFNKMNYDGKAQHMVQMIGKPFLGKLYHNKSEDGKQTYVNLDGPDGAWNIGAPESLDPVTEVVTPVPVPEMHGKPKVFLWENKSMTEEDVKEMWESIYIDGVRTDDSGKETSKNWIQETIMNNLEWEGSDTQAWTQEHVSLDDVTSQEVLEDVPTLD